MSPTRAGAGDVLQMCQDAMACRMSCTVSALCGIRQVGGGLDDRLGRSCWRHATDVCDVSCLRHAGHCDWCVEPHTVRSGVYRRSCLRHGRVMHKARRGKSRIRSSQSRSVAFYLDCFLPCKFARNRLLFRSFCETNRDISCDFVILWRGKYQHLRIISYEESIYHII